MNEEEKADLKQSFFKIMTTITESHSTIGLKIKDPNFPIEPLIDCLNLHRKTLEKNWSFAFHVDQSKVKEIDQLHTDTCKKLTALTLLQKREQRKNRMLWHYCMGWGSAAIAFIGTPLAMYFNKEVRTMDTAFQFFTIYATLGAFFHARRAHIKAAPKPMLSDAVKEVLPDLHESRFNELKWLKPDLTDDSSVSKYIRGIEAERKFLNTIASWNIPENKEKLEAIAPSQRKLNKLAFKDAKNTRNIDAVLRLAYLMDPKLNKLFYA